MPVVLVHGFLVGPLSCVWLARQLRRSGFQPHTFSYSTREETLSDAAERLLAYGRRLQVNELHWVGHSLGGLVILAMLEAAREHNVDLPPGRVVLLGSPVRGAAAAEGLAQHPLGAWLLGQAHGSLRQSFQTAPIDRPTTAIRGTRSLGMGRWFEALPTPNDGTVAVAETALEGAQCVDVPTTHAGLLLSPTVAKHVVAALTSTASDGG